MSRHLAGVLGGFDVAYWSPRTIRPRLSSRLRPRLGAIAHGHGHEVAVVRMVECRFACRHVHVDDPKLCVLEDDVMMRLFGDRNLRPKERCRGDDEEQGTTG